MPNSLDLKNIEQKAFRATYQDGLWDIQMGGEVLCMSILAYSTSSEAKPFLRFGLFLAGLAVFYLIFWGGKKYITAPRLGQVKFGPRRQKRKLIMVSVLAGIVLLQVILLVGTILLWKNPQWATNLGLHTSNRDLERMVVAVIGALFVGPSMVLLAYFNDFLRGYYIAVIVSLAVFALIWFGQPIFLIIAGLLIMIPGVILFVNFMRKYPLPPAEASHD
jgi:magnesium-transporting ATPase (P-type)